MSFRLKTIESNPLFNLSKSGFNNDIFLIISRFECHQNAKASSLNVISVNNSFCDTTSLEKTDKLVATISNSSFSSADFGISELFFSKLENNDSIAPNLEIRILCLSSRFCLSSDKNILIKSISSSVFIFF